MKFWRSLFATLMLLGVLIAPITFIFPVNAQAGQVTLNPTDDAYTDGNNADSNYGSETTLNVSTIYLAYLKFDLSTIPELAFGISALLELYTSYGGVTEPRNVVACMLLNYFDNSWSEDTITANNHPPISGHVELDTDYVGNDETWYEWVVTEAVVNATANNATAVTILMRHTYGLMTPHMSFNSKEASLTKRPKLTVFWEGIVPEFPSFVILPLFMMATLLTVVYVKKRKNESLVRMQ